MDGRVEPHTTDAELEGLDESQRAEVHVYEGGGPTDGIVLTDMTRDRGEDYVEDERGNEIMPEEMDAAGMSILSTEETADDLIEGDLDADLIEESDDDEL